MLSADYINTYLNHFSPLYVCRYSRSYRILMGMWFGADKPDFETFMMPFAKSFNQLYTKGKTFCLVNLLNMALWLIKHTTYTGKSSGN